MMKLIFRVTLVGILLFSMPNATIAEVYLGIEPLDNLSELRSKFPNATFTKENPAWAKEQDALFTITGPGISGTLVILFYDYYGKWKKEVEAEPDPKKRKAMTDLPHPSENSEIIRWVRWIPDSPFPVARLITKYGKPEITDFANDDYRQYKEWKKRGIQAFLTDDGKKVVNIDFTFTAKEQSDASVKKFGIDLTGYQKAKKK